MVLGIISENFRSLWWKLCPWHAFEVYASSTKWWVSAFVKGITSDNNLINLCEIGLFHIVWGVSKGTCDNYHVIWWKCYRTKVYQYVYTNFGSSSTLHFRFIIHKNGKRTQAWPIIKSTSFQFLKKFPSISSSLSPCVLFDRKCIGFHKHRP